jgi:glyceraldehyde 3-phosphate dehydrogenase
MAVKVGINGFGRIGRNFLRAVRQTGADVDFVGVNDITDAKTLAHLLKYDSVLGRLDADVTVSENGLSVDGDELRVFAERDPAQLPWKEVGAEIVIESTDCSPTGRKRRLTSRRAPRRSSSARRPRARTSRS